MIAKNYFDGIYGHEGIKKLLETALSTGRIGHAYIFCGAEGVGRYTVARAFANGIVRTEYSEHPDIITVSNELYGVESKSDSILVDTVSEMRKDIFIKPYSGERKVYIIPRADTMNISSQNKLLKVLEEPPLYCTMILIAENVNKFLETILSRATVIRFNPLSESQVADYLTENCDVLENEAVLKAIMSGGSIGQAVKLLGSDELNLIRTQTIDGFLDLLSSENKYIFEYARFLKSNKNDINFIFSVLRSFFEDFVHLKHGIAEGIVNKDVIDKMRKLGSRVTKRAAVQFLDITIKYERVSNANFRIAMFLLACEYWEEIHGRNYRSTI